MPIPKCRDKFFSQSLINPEMYYQYLRNQGVFNEQRIPQSVVVCFSPDLLEYSKSKYTLSKKCGFNIGELYGINEMNEKVGIFVCRGVGAPGAVINLEELVVFGVEKFLIIGTAGSLQSHVNPGDIVLCEGALRDEGTSYHYVLEGDVLHPSSSLLQKLTESLNVHNIPHHTGLTWTIDAPYRETREEVKRYQKKGILTVEMEASACFSVAQFRQKEIGAIFAISDTLAGLEWQPKFFSNETQNALYKAFNFAIDFFSSQYKD